jgi:phosphoribosylformylglycinamidine synthase
VEGGKQAVAEAYRNLCAVGAKPLAITNCLNFGNPQRPEIMGQFVGCVEGMAEACRALDFPVVSGNVSLYNETKGEDGSSLAILPTPAIGGVGLLDDWEKSATIGFKAEGNHLWLIGAEKLGGHLGQSLWLREILGRSEGVPPTTDLTAEKKAGEIVRWAIANKLVTAVHDISDGGLLVAIAEMALAGGMGAQIDPDWSAGGNVTAQMFGEAQGRYIVAVADAQDYRVIERAKEQGLPTAWLGISGGDNICIGDGPELHNFGVIEIADLRAAHEGFFPRLMGSELTPEF